jgi:hypothetical protein
MSTFEDVKFRLARVGAQDIEPLQDDPDRSEAASTLREGGKSVVKIGNTFPTFRVDMWTDFPWAFDTERNSLVLRFWSLLFSSTFELSAGLVHEANHYRYLKKRGMLGKPESIQEEFAKQHKRRMEILAHEEELMFLKRTANLFPDEIGVPMPKGYLTFSKNEVIQKCRHNLMAWSQNADYSVDYKKGILATSKTNYGRIAEVLGIDLTGIKDKRGSIKLRFWQ